MHICMITFAAAAKANALHSLGTLNHSAPCTLGTA